MASPDPFPPQGAQINGMTLTGSADPEPGFRALDEMMAVSMERCERL